MMLWRFLILWALISFASLSFADLNLYNFKYAPQPSNSGGHYFPRNHMDLYRGITKEQYDYLQAARAMLGDKSANVESAMLTTIKQGLMGAPQPLLSIIPNLATEYNSFKFAVHIAQILKEKNKIGLSESEAFEEALKLMSASYTDDVTKAYYIDYASPYWVDFPRAYMYSTLHLEVAKIYGSNILIFNEKSNKRSLDLNYWNFVNNRKWVKTNLSYPDRGEFISAFYIPAQQVIGYQHARSNFGNIVWNVWSPLTADLNLVLMKKNNLLFAFDGSGLSHIVQDGDVFCSAISVFDPNSEFPEMPKADCRAKPKLVAIFKTCSEKPCSVPASYFENYEMSPNSFTGFIKRIGDLTINGQKVYKFIKGETIEIEKKKDEVKSEAPPAEANKTAEVAPTTTTTIAVPTTTTTIAAPTTTTTTVALVVFYYGPTTTTTTTPARSKPSIGDVIAARAKSKGKNSCALADANTLICDLSGKSLSPGQTLTLTIPSETAGKSAYFAQLTHYQDPAAEKGLDKKRWDSTPGYSSVQFHSVATAHATDPWRYLILPEGKKFGPLGSLYAEVVTADKARSKSLVFEGASHSGTSAVLADTAPIYFDQIRIQNVGTDTVYYKELQVVIK